MYAQDVLDGVCTNSNGFSNKVNIAKAESYPVPYCTSTESRFTYDSYGWTCEDGIAVCGAYYGSDDTVDSENCMNLEPPMNSHSCALDTGTETETNTENVSQGGACASTFRM